MERSTPWQTGSGRNPEAEHVGKCLRLFDVQEHHRWKYRIDLEISFEILVDIRLIMAQHEVNIDVFCDRILRNESCGTVAEEIANAIESTRPQRCIERGIVDIANQQ